MMKIFIGVLASVLVFASFANANGRGIVRSRAFFAVSTPFVPSFAFAATPICHSAAFVQFAAIQTQYVQPQVIVQQPAVVAAPAVEVVQPTPFVAYVQTLVTTPCFHSSAFFATPFFGFEHFGQRERIRQPRVTQRTVNFSRTVTRVR